MLNSTSFILAYFLFFYRLSSLHTFPSFLIFVHLFNYLLSLQNFYYLLFLQYFFIPLYYHHLLLFITTILIYSPLFFSFKKVFQFCPFSFNDVLLFVCLFVFAFLHFFFLIHVISSSFSFFVFLLLLLLNCYFVHSFISLSAKATELANIVGRVDVENLRRPKLTPRY